MRDHPAQGAQERETSGPAEAAQERETSGPAEAAQEPETSGPAEAAQEPETSGPAGTAQERRAGPAGEPVVPDEAETAGWRPLEGEFVLAMRRSGSIMQLLGQVAADRIGINPTDLNCLNIVALSGRMTAGELARETGLTTASITGVLDRLEESGFVRRERDPHDRRRVIVRLNAGRGLRDIAPVFAPMVHAWRTVAARYSDDELRLIVDFQRQVQELMRDHLTRMRETTAAPRGAGREPPSVQ